MVKGLAELIKDLKALKEELEDPELVTVQLANSMRKFVHVRTGHLKSTIYHDFNIAGATAAYAGFEAARGGEHDFAQRAVDDFDMEAYADAVWKPIEG